MAALLAVFVAFEREILGERVRAGLAHARQNRKRLGRPLTAGLHAATLDGYTALTQAPFRQSRKELVQAPRPRRLAENSRFSVSAQRLQISPVTVPNHSCPIRFQQV